MTPDERIAELEAENAALRARVSEIPRLRAQIPELATQVQELQARLAQDRHHSNNPPSSDPLGRKRPRRQRPRSGQKPGGQLGHQGETLHLVATPDELVEHRPPVCTPCQAPLDQPAPVVGDERRQVHELPPVRLVVREHRALGVRCPRCAQVSAGRFPAQAPSRAQSGPQLRALVVDLVEQQLIPYARGRERLVDLVGASASVGPLTRWVQQSAAVLRPVEDAIKAALGRVPGLQSDETGVRRAGKLAWAQVASTARLTHYAIQAQRGAEATQAIGILPNYRGVSVHDGWKPYRVYTACRHARCNIPHLRELTFLEEQYRHGWAKELKIRLLAMKDAAEPARTRGEQRLADAERRAFVVRYKDLLAAGLAANPPPPVRRPGQRARVKHSPARTLLERLGLGQDAVLAFLEDLTLPFDNHQAEQDLRMLKVPHKIAGSFRAPAGAEAFARIRGYLVSLRKQGAALLAALQSVCIGQPLYPALD